MDVGQYVAGETRTAAHHIHLPPNNPRYTKLGTPRAGASISVTGVIIGSSEDVNPQVAVKCLPIELRDISFISEGDGHVTTHTLKGTPLTVIPFSL
jgi:hypothetical protein